MFDTACWRSGTRGVTCSTTVCRCQGWRTTYNWAEIPIPPGYWPCFQKNNSRWTECRGAFASHAHEHHSSNASQVAEQCIQYHAISNMLEEKLKRSGKRFQAERHADLRHPRQRRLNLRWFQKSGNPRVYTPVPPCQRVTFTQTSLLALLLLILPAQRQNNIEPPFRIWTFYTEQRGGIKRYNIPFLNRLYTRGYTPFLLTGK